MEGSLFRANISPNCSKAINPVCKCLFRLVLPGQSRIFQSDALSFSEIFHDPTTCVGVRYFTHTTLKIVRAMTPAYEPGSLYPELVSWRIFFDFSPGRFSPPPPPPLDFPTARKALWGLARHRPAFRGQNAAHWWNERDSDFNGIGAANAYPELFIRRMNSAPRGNWPRAALTFHSRKKGEKMPGNYAGLFVDDVDVFWGVMARDFDFRSFE